MISLQGDFFLQLYWKMDLKMNCNAFLSSAGQLRAWAICGWMTYEGLGDQQHRGYRMGRSDRGNKRATGKSKLRKEQPRKRVYLRKERRRGID